MLRRAPDDEARTLLWHVMAGALMTHKANYPLKDLTLGASSPQPKEGAEQ